MWAVQLPILSEKSTIPENYDEYTAPIDVEKHKTLEFHQSRRIGKSRVPLWQELERSFGFLVDRKAHQGGETSSAVTIHLACKVHDCGLDVNKSAH